MKLIFSFVKNFTLTHNFLTLFDESTLKIFEMPFSDALIRFGLASNFKDAKTFDVFTKHLIIQTNSNCEKIDESENERIPTEDFIVPKFLKELKTCFNVLNVLSGETSNVIFNNL